MRLLTPDETLNTNDMNQNRFTRPPVSESVRWIENWSVDAVTLEKKVAMVVMLTYRFVAFLSSVVTKQQLQSELSYYCVYRHGKMFHLCCLYTRLILIIILRHGLIHMSDYTLT